MEPRFRNRDTERFAHDEHVRRLQGVPRERAPAKPDPPLPRTAHRKQSRLVGSGSRYGRRSSLGAFAVGW